MNPQLQPFFARRSVREFRPEALPDAVLRDLLEAAMAAPSACCKDPWQFVTVRDRARLARLAEGLPNGRFLADAAAGIVVCGIPAEAHDRQQSYLLQDCSAAIENILVAAPMLGWGACWLGIHPREERIRHLRTALGLPEHVLPIAILAIGRPAEPPTSRTRYAEHKVHAEKW
jgi:nitroreductase